jgi:TrmH family RNA methyltransferase
VFGSEGQGVGVDWLVRASQHLRIPQTPWVESLNVASSCAICLFEQVRQRALLEEAGA